MKYLLSLSFVFLACFVNSQPLYKFWVEFTDKNGTPYTIDHPQAFLSQKAIDRRIKHQVGITEMDLPVTPSYVKHIDSLGGTVLHRSKWFNAVTISSSDSSLPLRLSHLACVKRIDTLVWAADTLQLKPADLGDLYSWPSGGQQNEAIGPGALRVWRPGQFNGVERYGAMYEQCNLVAVDYLHNHGYTGQGLTIAVFDAGFMHVERLEAFEHLWDEGRILGARDFVSPGNSVFEQGYHGTMVFSILAASSPGVAVGTAPGASYWLLRTEDAATETPIEECNWLAAAEFADSAGVDIVNSSLGYTTFDDTAQSHTYAQMNGRSTLVTRAADMLASKGVLIVNSAGNSGRKPWRYIGAPADADRVLTVGAVDSDGLHAYFSSVGPTADGRIKPTIVATGQNTYLVNVFGKITQANGTSLSSPIVCGGAACLWQKFPSLTADELLELIKQSGHRHGRPDTLVGYGIADFCKASLSQSGTGPGSFLILNHVFDHAVEMLIDNNVYGRQVYTIELRNQVGGIVYSRKAGANSVGGTYLYLDDMAHVPPGIYNLELSGAGVHMIHTVVKAHWAVYPW